MKKCAYCGRENEDTSVHCSECGTEFVHPSPPKPVPEPEPVRHRYQIHALSPAEAKLDLVTIVSCQTLFDADVVVSELEAAGIQAIIPDEFLAEAWAFNLNALGYVRVQVSPQDYEAAKDVIEDADRLTATPSGPATA
jgi:hypothetical protein